MKHVLGSFVDWYWPKQSRSGAQGKSARAPLSLHMVFESLAILISTAIRNMVCETRLQSVVNAGGEMEGEG